MGGMGVICKNAAAVLAPRRLHVTTAVPRTGGREGRATLSCAACTSAKRRQAKGGVWIQIMEGKKEGLEEEEPRSERYG